MSETELEALEDRLRELLSRYDPPPELLPKVLAALRDRQGAGLQLAELSRRFPDALVEDKGGQAYVAHENITQRLLSVVGPFSFKLVEIIRGDVPAIPPDPKGRSQRAKDGSPELRNVIVGGVWSLAVNVDGRLVELEEAGDVEDPHNWNHDGARLKQAASDAIKRCAMRVGLGTHLWAGRNYFLDKQLAKQLGTTAQEAETG